MITFAQNRSRRHNDHDVGGESTVGIRQGRTPAAVRHPRTPARNRPPRAPAHPAVEIRSPVLPSNLAHVLTPSDLNSANLPHSSVTTSGPGSVQNAPYVTVV